MSFESEHNLLVMHLLVLFSYYYLLIIQCECLRYIFVAMLVIIIEPPTHLQHFYLKLFSSIQIFFKKTSPKMLTVSTIDASHLKGYSAKILPFMKIE